MYSRPLKLLYTAVPDSTTQFKPPVDCDQYDTSDDICEIVKDTPGLYAIDCSKESVVESKRYVVDFIGLVCQKYYTTLIVAFLRFTRFNTSPSSALVNFQSVHPQ